MAAIFRRYISVAPLNEYFKLLRSCLQPRWGLLWCLSFLALGTTKLQAATTGENWRSPEQLTPQLTPDAAPGNFHLLPDKKLVRASVTPHALEQQQPFLIAGPNNFNPNLRSEPPSVTTQEVQPTTSPTTSPTTQPATAQQVAPTTSPTASPSPPPPAPSSPLPPPPPPPPQPPAYTPPTASTATEKPTLVLENIQTDFRNDIDNFGRENRFIEPTAQFRLNNGNIIRFKTGYNTFALPETNFVSNIPLQVGYETKIGNITVQGGAGVDTFNRLPAAVNLNARVDAPVAPNVTLSGVVEQGPYKFNAETLENQITSWRYGPNLYWQIDRQTYLFSLLRLGNYNDGNFEQQSFTRLERKFGDFFVAANLFNWSYTNDVQDTSGYFSPPDFIVYTGEVGWEGQVFDFLRCRVTASLGQQRLNGEFDTANNYQGRCTTRFSPNVDADFGYTFSNVQNRQTGDSAYNNQSFTGVLRVKF